MKAYIGTKIIKAEKMYKEDFDYKFKRKPGKSFVTEGYHVEYSNPDGSKYDSWSPKDVFERAYRPVSEDEKTLLV